MNQDNNAQSNPEETVVVDEASEAVEAAGVNPDGANPDGDSKTAPVLEKQDIETTEKVNYGFRRKFVCRCKALGYPKFENYKMPVHY